MKHPRGLFGRLGDLLDQAARGLAQKRLRDWLPSKGNVLFGFALISGLLFANRAGALTLFAPVAVSTQVMPYQGRLAAAGGLPLTGSYAMTFALYDVASAGVPLWTETWSGPNSVTVRDGLFNVALGSLLAIPQSAIANRANVWLGITVGSDAEMSPRVQLGSVPFAVQALTVPDGSITAAKLASDVSLVPPAASITTAMLANDSVTPDKIPNRLRTQWMPAATFRPLADTPIYYAVDNWSANGYFLSHGGSDGIISTFGIPSDKLANTAITITFHYASAGTSGDFRVRYGWKLLRNATGGSLANPETAIVRNTPIAANAWQVVSVDEIVPGSLAAPDSAFGVYLHRLGTEAPDTLAQDLVFIGLSIVYQADN